MAGPERISLRLLGPFECLGPDGGEIAIQAAKQRGVLAYLALAHGKRAPRGELAALFWSGSGEAQARQSLRQCLSSLRKALGEAALVSDGADVGLDPGRVHVDVDEVLGGLSLLEDAPACGPSRYVRGPLLSGLVFGEDPADDFLRDARVRLQDAGQRLLLRCASQQARAGEDEALIETYWRLLKLCPACEEAHRGLMEVYARLGPGSASPWHHHGEHTTYVLLLQGECVVEFGEERLHLRADGSMGVVPPGLVHREINTGATKNQFLVMRVGHGPAVFPAEPPAAAS